VQISSYQSTKRAATGSLLINPPKVIQKGMPRFPARQVQADARTFWQDAQTLNTQRCQTTCRELCDARILSAFAKTGVVFVSRSQSSASISCAALISDTRRQRRYLRHSLHRCGPGLRVHILSILPRSRSIPSIAVWSTQPSRDQLRADSHLQHGQRSLGWLTCQRVRVGHLAE
jgi:hypothetical protein